MASPLTILGLEAGATDAQIKSAYRKAARQHHPDKGGDAERFRTARRAFDILSNPEARARASRKSHSYEANVPFSLEELIMETAKDINLSSVRYHKLPVPCTFCQNTNFFASICPNCQGAGEVPEEGDGSPHIEKFRVRATRGMRDGSTVVIAGRGVQRCGMLVGDVIVRIKELPHAQFTRQGDDLHAEVRVPMAQALVGFTREIVHPDGNTVIVECSNPDAPITIANRGMPIAGTKGCGALVVRTSVYWEPLEAEVRVALRAALAAAAEEKARKQREAEEERARKQREAEEERARKQREAEEEERARKHWELQQKKANARPVLTFMNSFDGL